MSIHGSPESRFEGLKSAVNAKTEATERLLTKVREEMAKLSSTQHHQLNMFNGLDKTFSHNKAVLGDIISKFGSVAERIQRVEEYDLADICSRLESIQNNLDQTVDLGDIDRVLNDGELLSIVIVLYGSCDAHQTTLPNYTSQRG